VKNNKNRKNNLTISNNKIRKKILALIKTIKKKLKLMKVYLEKIVG